MESANSWSTVLDSALSCSTMKSWDKGFSVTVQLGKEGKSFRVRYRCPWCGENSNIAAASATVLPDDYAALLVVCEANQCRKPSMVVVRFLNTGLSNAMIDPVEIHPNPRLSY